MWGWNMGPCGDNPSTEMLGASNRLQEKFNNPVVQSQTGFYTNTEYFETRGQDWDYDINNPAYPAREYIIYWGSNYYQCIEHEELNFYLNKFDEIKSQLVPTDKDFASVEVLDDQIGGFGSDGAYMHTYKIYYGDFNLSSGGIQ